MVVWLTGVRLRYAGAAADERAGFDRDDGGGVVQSQPIQSVTFQSQRRYEITDLALWLGGDRFANPVGSGSGTVL